MLHTVDVTPYSIQKLHTATHLGRATQAASPVARCATSASTPLRRMRSRWWASPSLRPANARPAADCRNCSKGGCETVSVGTRLTTQSVMDTRSDPDWHLYWD
jgi:hypothetical protein